MTNSLRLAQMELEVEPLKEQIATQQIAIDYLLKELDVLKTLILIFGSDRVSDYPLRPK